MAEPIEELKKIRLEKLGKLKDLKINPFGQTKTSRIKISEAKLAESGAYIAIAGRIRAVRGHGGSSFCDLHDESGKLQGFFSKDVLGEQKYSLLELLDIGDFISVSGNLFKTNAGELTIKVTDFSLLTKSLHPLPSSFYGFKDTEDRYRQRYVDLLVNSEVRYAFAIRNKVISQLRKVLDDTGFSEVETPVLQPLYGGATAKPFITHHKALDIDLYLRISDELYLKRLIVGGFEKVYEIGKDFRNEGMDREHNPEFTMLEFYWAYSTYEELMDFTEELISTVVENVMGTLNIKFEDKDISFEPPWERLTFKEALIKFVGMDIDKYSTEESVLNFVKEKNIKLDLSGVVGYAPLLDELYKKTVRQNLTGPVFLIDHPYEMKPLAKRKEDDPKKAASFQLLICGKEIINAYNELNDPIDQRARWEDEQKMANAGLVEYQVLDEDYIRALEYGMPPTAGWGMGIDRFVSILTGNHTIKDVILFPTMRPESLSGRPDPQAGGEGSRLLTVDSGKDSSVQVPQNDKKESLAIEPSGSFPTREKVLEIVKDHIKSQNLLRHCLAVEAAMKALAKRLGGNEEIWGILGLIHDADWEETKSDVFKHTVVALEWLKNEGHTEGPVVQGLKSHNAKHTKLSELSSLMEWSLECCDELTGFIVSVALVRPDKKLASVEVESVLKKWKAKEFAAAVDRSQIEQCEEKLGIKLNDFIELVLNSMKSIAPEIGL